MSITTRLIEWIFNSRDHWGQQRIIVLRQFAARKPPHPKAIGIVSTAIVVFVIANVEKAIRTRRVRCDPAEEVDDVIRPVVVLASNVKGIDAAVASELNKIVRHGFNMRDQFRPALILMYGIGVVGVVLNRRASGRCGFHPLNIGRNRCRH